MNHPIKENPSDYGLEYENFSFKTEDDIILEEVQIGYLLNSMVLRPTKVVIAKTKTDGEK